MAITVGRATVAAAAIEVTKGTRPTMAANTHGFYLVDSPVGVGFEQNIQTIRKQSTTLNATTKVPTYRVWLPRMSTPFVGGAAADGPPRWAPLLRCAGFSQTVNAATSVVYALQSSTIETATIVTEQGARTGSDKIVREVNGVNGTCRISASTTQEWRVSFDGQGVYLAETLETITDAIGGAWSGGPAGEGSPLLSGTARLKINNGGSDYFVCLNSFDFSTNTEIIRKLDMNAGATGGLASVDFDDMDPTITLGLGQDPDGSANVTDLDFYDDIDASTAHNIDFAWVDALGRTFTFDITATPTNITDGGDGPFVQNTVTYDVTTMTITQT